MSVQTHKTKLNIGLFGFGVVGEGLYKVLEQTPSLNAQIKKVCIKHPEKERNAPKELFTDDANILHHDESINVIVELIDDAEAAYTIVTRALRHKKAVVSANKKMIAEHIEELIALQQEFETPFLYEAACCASIPVIRNLEEYYDHDLLRGISGIVNGSTNYILTKIAHENTDYQAALQEAQAAGFAESNPTLDVNGIDAVNKLSILLTHAYGIIVKPNEIVHTGIQNLDSADAQYAVEKGYEIKLIAKARKLTNGEIAAFVMPQFTVKGKLLASVKNEFNGVIIESGLADEQFFYGKGAGSFPTASAVLSDISALRYHYKYEYKKLKHQIPAILTKDFYVKAYFSFSNISQVPRERFKHILEWRIDKNRCQVCGILSFEMLAESDWWKQEDISVIFFSDSIIENHELAKELAPVDEFVEEENIN